MLIQILSVYNWLLVARILLSWFTDSQRVASHPVGYWLYALTEPVLSLFRRIPFAIIGGVIDISPIFAFLSIRLLQNFLVNIASQASLGRGAMSFFINLALGLTSIVRTAFFILAIISLLRLLYMWFAPKTHSTMLNQIDYYTRRLHQKQLRFLGAYKQSIQYQVLVLFVLSSLFTYLLILLESSLRIG